MAGYADAAVSDQSPAFAKYDTNGQGVRGEFSSEFLNWCAENGKDPRTVAALQFGVYLDDLMILARTQDPRAREIFRRGLESPNPLVIASSVQGLGRLQDREAIPLISKAAARLRVGERLVISMNLPWYSNIEAARLMERLTPDPKMREFMTRQVQEEQLVERERLLRRQGRGPQQ